MIMKFTGHGQVDHRLTSLAGFLNWPLHLLAHGHMCKLHVVAVSRSNLRQWIDAGDRSP